MLKRIVVKNIGVLRAFETQKTPPLEKLSLFYARNGRGKSTLSAVLRASHEMSATSVLSRRSLGNDVKPPHVVLETDDGNIVFSNSIWSKKGPNIEVFDATFIADNIYAGEVVDLEHDRGLFSVIIGHQGARLARQLEKFNKHVKSTSDQLKVAKQNLQADLPTDLELEAFIALPNDPSYKEQLEDADRVLNSLKNAERRAQLKSFEPLSLPTLPWNLLEVLESSIDDVESSSRTRLVEHFDRFKLGNKAEEWVSFGLDHIHDESCPFCGRFDVDQEGTITLYKKIFSATYKEHFENIKTAARQIETMLGDGFKNLVSEKLSSNTSNAILWIEYIKLDYKSFDLGKFSVLIATVYNELRELLHAKRNDPLEPIKANEKLQAAFEAFDKACFLVNEYNQRIEEINAVIKSSSEKTTNRDLAFRNRVIIAKRIDRFSSGVEQRIDLYRQAQRREKRARNVRVDVQNRLKTLNENLSKKYHNRVNFYLSEFASTFSISEIKNSMQGNNGQTDYDIIIQGVPVLRGRGRQEKGTPSFRNALSSGDKATLAFAFFLAKLDSQDSLADKIVVIDDPLSSHDSNRRHKTIQVIKDLSQKCQQVITLSHDAYFLRELDMVASESNIKTAAYKIDVNSSDGRTVVETTKLEELCISRHARMISELLEYVDNRIGRPDDIVLSIRQVLETHYRQAYRAYFGRDENLGRMVLSIKKEGPNHPCYQFIEKLGSCNVTTRNFHHGDHASVRSQNENDPEQLAVIAADALELICARKPRAT